jgi:hypothetical protein
VAGQEEGEVRTMKARRENIHEMLERGNRLLILQGTFSLKMIEIAVDFIVPCHVSDVVKIIEKEDSE